MAKIKVMHIVERGRVVGGGAERVAVNIVNHLDREKFEPSMAIIVEDPGHTMMPDTDVPLFVLPGGGAFSFSTIRALRRLLKRQKIEIAQSHLPRPNAYNWLATKFIGTIGVGTMHGYGILDASESPKARWLARKALNGLAKTVCVSHHLKNDLTANLHVPGGKLVVIHNCFDKARIETKSAAEEIQRFREKYGLSSDTRTILAIGHLRPVKGYDILFDALKNISGKYNRLNLLVAGYEVPEEKSRLEAVITALPSNIKINFLGEFNDIALLFAVAELYISASHREGFSITTVEAMAAGLPVVATDSGGPGEIVLPGRTGLLVPPGDVDRLAEAVARLLDDPRLANSMGEQGLQRAYEEFSLDKFIDNYQALYINLMNRQG